MFFIDHFEKWLKNKTKKSKKSIILEMIEKILEILLIEWPKSIKICQ